MNKTINLNHNLIANYLNQGYRAFIGLLLMPVYLNLLGKEAFGLIAFYLMSQSLMQLLDIGLKPTMGRECSKFTAGIISKIKLNDTLRTFECFFYLVGIIIVLIWVFNSSYIANEWLNIKNINEVDALNIINCMAIVLFLRWISTLYIGFISALERQIALNGVNIVFTTLRFVGVLVPIIYYDKSIVVFFIYTLVISLIEYIFFFCYTYKYFKLNFKAKLLRKNELKELLSFSYKIAIGSFVWISITHSDKLILSNKLNLIEFGYFSLATSLAAGVVILGNSASSAIMPRLSTLYEEGNFYAYNTTYISAFKKVMFLVVPLVLTISIMSDEILLLWTQSEEVTTFSSDILYWYILGNFLVSINSFAFYLQYSKNQLSLHVLSNYIYFIIGVPLLSYFALYGQPVSVGISWFLLNLTMLLTFTTYIHYKLLRTKYFEWFFILFKIFCICIFSTMLHGIDFINNYYLSVVFTYFLFLIVYYIMIYKLNCKKILQGE